MKNKKQTFKNKFSIKHLKFTKMKKQLLTLSLVLLTLFVGNRVFGQNITAPIVCQAAQTIQCLPGDALHVIPGSPYLYTVAVPNITATTGQFMWFVTQNPNFITTGTLNTANAENPNGTGTILAGVGTTGGGYLNTPAGTATIELIWKAFDPTLDVFVVIQVTGTDAADCPVNNLKVYKILPQNAFTLDIANVDANAGTPAALAWNLPISTCVPGIVTATYDDATTTVKYDYGQSYAYYLINAANFSGNYVLNFQIDGVANGEVVTAEWAYNAGATLTWTPLTITGTAPSQLTATTTVNAQAANQTVGSSGECILVRLLIDHTTSVLIFNEGIVAEPIQMAIDGTTGGALLLPDLHHATGANCGLADGFTNDKATHTLRPRPQINATTPTPFVTGTGL